MLTNLSHRTRLARRPFVAALAAALLALLLSGTSRTAGAHDTGAGNPGVVEIDAAEVGRYTQVAALSDVHGHLLNALAMLKRAQIVNDAGQWRAGKTLLIVTGDSIDKGPASLGVLRLWIDLQRHAPEQGGRVLALLGNHEAEFLADPTAHSKSDDLGDELAHEGMTRAQLARDGVDRHGYKLGAFLRGMPLAARVGNWLFCHAGWPPDPHIVAPGQSTAEMRWTAWTRAAGLQSYSALSLETPSVDKQGPYYCVLQKKYVGEAGNLAAQDQNAAKWWEDPREVGRLLTRLDQYGLTGVVFGHQPKAFGLSDAVGPYTDPETHRACYRLLKIDSGMADAPTDGQDNGVMPPHAGHLLLFHDPRVFLQRPEAFQAAQPIPGMVAVGAK